MKKNIHPKYNDQCKVKCVCGNTFTVGSTKDNLDIEVCSECHPFFSGKEKLIDTEGRVKKFQSRVTKSTSLKDKVAKKKIKKATRNNSKNKTKQLYISIVI